MERDFMGLNSKEPLVVVKEEVNTDGYKEIGFASSSGLQWTFANKVSAVPQLMNFNFAEGYATELQKSFNHSRNGGSRNHFPLAASYVQHDVKMFPTASNAFVKIHFATTGQNLPFNTMKPQLLGGIPVTAPHSVLPTFGSVGGSIEPWKNVKASGSSPQLTIFYGGEVNVFDDITPEKAQAIMFLAGNGSSMTSHPAYPKARVQTPVLKPVQVDTVPANQLINIQLGSGMPAQSCSGSTSTEDQTICKTPGTPIPSTLISRLEPPKLVNTMGSVAATGMMPSVPQARKASLARFLEKRKERVMSAASPYNLSKKSLDYTTTLEFITASPYNLSKKSLDYTTTLESNA